MKNKNKKNRSHWDTKEIIALKAKFEKERRAGKSERQISEALGVPRSTFRDWNQRSHPTNLSQAVIDFFNTTEGFYFLHVLITAITFVIAEVSKKGIRVAQLIFEITGINKLAACSYGKLQQDVVAMEDKIILFEKSERSRLSKYMKKKKITVVKDETEQKGKPHLVAIEPVSNFILAEGSSKSRDSESWHQAIQTGIAGLNVEIIQSTSDQGTAIKKYRETYLEGAHHSPDLFHIEHEVHKATAGPLASKRRKYEKELEKAEQLLFLDGVYMTDQSKGNRAVFRQVEAPTLEELTLLAQTISERIGRYLERQGLLVRDLENSYLTRDNLDDDSLSQLQGHSITYRIAVGPQAGRKVFTLQTLPAQSPAENTSNKVAKVAGFSLHAGVASKAHQRKKLERLCRYISRPAVSTKRIDMTAEGKVRYELKTPYRNGTTHVIFEPLDFIARLAALVPKPRVNLTRFHGVFAPNSQYRSTVTSDKDNKGKAKAKEGVSIKTEGERRAGMTWAQRLKRVFTIDIETCSECGGFVKVIACIEEPATIKKILNHLKKKSGKDEQVQLPPNRAPPQMELFN